MSACDKPLVSIIIATYNSSETLRLTLESVLNQDSTHFEVWVVGDCCTDDTESVVTALIDSRVNWINLPRNTGSQAEPNNEGLRRARGRYIAYVGHDDLWFPSHLSGLLAFIERTGADFVHALAVRIGPSGPVNVVGPPSAGRTYECHTVPPSSWLHRSEIIEDCGLWRSHLELPRAIDRDYSRAAFLRGKTIEFCPQLTVLKFPSALFSMYSLREEIPQRSYFEQLAACPEELREKILSDLAIASARQRAPGDESILETTKRALWVLRKNLYDTYGRENWPLATYLRWRFQRNLQRKRRKRGLPPSRL